MLRSARRIAVLTSGRQDYGILRSTIHALADAPDFELLLWAGGMHLNERFGRTIEGVRRDGVPVDRTLPFVGEPPDPAADAAAALGQIAAALEAERPDALLLLGDRHETLAAAFAACLQGVPVIHLHGGEETEGAVDNALRHAITKLSHLHLVSHPLHARRVIQMGEAPEMVRVVGLPGVDNAYRPDLPDRGALVARLALPLDPPVVVVTMHPATLGDDPTQEVEAVAAAMARVDATYVITQPNADRGGASIREFWAGWAPGRPRVVVVDALGEAYYWGLLRQADAVLGNSSSGILEAPVLGLAVVDVGERQRGRLCWGEVVSVAAEAEAIAAALETGLRRRLDLAAGPAERLAGPAAPRILAAIREWAPPRPPRKSFHLLP